MSQAAVKVKMIKAPVMEYAGNPSDFILGFFRKLGWTNENLNPKRIEVSEQQWHEMCQTLIDDKENESGKLLFLNYGPSASKDVPYGKVRLTPGWMTKEEEGQ